MKRRFMLFLLSALGFTTACENEDKGTVCMYGTPLIDFELQGSVTDQKGSPIPGIEDRTGETSGSWNRGGRSPVRASMRRFRQRQKKSNREPVIRIARFFVYLLCG